MTAIAPATPPPLPTPSAPLTHEHMRQLADAQGRGRKIGRAVAIARFDGWSIATFAFLTLLLGFTSLPGVLLGAGMSAIAYFELRGARGLRALDPAAARALGMNQLALGSLLIIYACWRIYATLTGPGVYAEYAAADPQLGQMLTPFEDLTKLIHLAAYAGLILVSLIAQGGLSMYYFTRRGLIEAYLKHTPEWVVQLQRTGSLI